MLHMYEGSGLRRRRQAARSNAKMAGAMSRMQPDVSALTATAAHDMSALDPGGCSHRGPLPLRITTALLQQCATM